MARHYLGYTQRGLTSFRGLSKTPDGHALLFLEEGEIANVEQDFADFLDTGETVSTATVSTEGSLTAGSPTVASPKVTTQFSGSKAWGRAEITVTLSTGVKIITKIEVREKQRYIAARSLTDYLGLSERW